MGTLIQSGRILIGTEHLRCPRCGAIVRLPIHTDCPSRAYVQCSGCGFRDVMDFGPVLKKYGLRTEMSASEKTDTARWLSHEADKARRIR
jgi:ribosomal protein S27AE